MATPAEKEIEAELREFERALSSKLPGGLGAPLTRAEAALLRTYAKWRNARPSPLEPAVVARDPSGRATAAE